MNCSYTGRDVKKKIRRPSSRYDLPCCESNEHEHIESGASVLDKIYVTVARLRSSIVSIYFSLKAKS